MNFLHSMVRIRSIDDSLRFYCQGLGLELVKRVDVEAGRFSLLFLAAQDDLAAFERDKLSHLQPGLPMLELTHNWPPEGKGASEGLGEEIYSVGRNFGHIAFMVDDIYRICQHMLDMGYDLARPPRDGRMAFIKSPDNISVELLQKGKALEVCAPWKDMPNKGSW